MTRLADEQIFGASKKKEVRKKQSTPKQLMPSLSEVQERSSRVKQRHRNWLLFADGVRKATNSAKKYCMARVNTWIVVLIVAMIPSYSAQFPTNYRILIPLAPMIHTVPPQKHSKRSKLRCVLVDGIPAKPR